MPKEPSTFSALYELSSIGINLVMTTFIGGGIGYFLDTQVFGTLPWMSFIFLFLGIAAGFLRIFQLVRASQNNNSNNNGSGSDG